MNCPRNLRDDAIAIWKAGVAAVDARKLVREFISITDDGFKIGDQIFKLDEIERIILVGFGKASGAMAVGFEQALGNQLVNRIPVVGWVNVPDDKVFETQLVPVVGCRPPGENLPTIAVVAGTRRIIELMRSAGSKDLCICLISGGGSALLEFPVDPVTLDQFRAATSYLSSAGASIYELNAVRRVISQVKGGGLALVSGGAPVISLIISDVIGDHLDVIASGPTVESSGEFSAIDILEKYDPARTGLPEPVWTIVESDSKPKARTADELNVSNFVVGNIKTAMLAARQQAIELGYQVELDEPSGNEGDAGTVGRATAIQIAQLSVRPGLHCQIMGGETTVALCNDPGQGGRNQQLVLSALESIMNLSLDSGSEFCLLSGGTDGEDGNVSVAGALFDSQWIDSITDSQRSDLAGEIRDCLKRCDSHTFLREHGLVLKIPSTYTNVCDLRIALSYFSGT
jgi:glycerate 2-kinase